MNPIRSILVPTDFSACAAKALDHAIAMAKVFGAEVTLLHVVPVPTSYSPFQLVPLPNQWLQAMSSDARKRLEAERTRVGPTATKVDVIHGRPADGIVTVAVEGKHDMIVIGTHGWTGVKHAILGSIAERVVRDAPVPVLTVRTRE